jgi:hypothetical protein
VVARFKRENRIMNRGATTSAITNKDKQSSNLARGGARFLSRSSSHSRTPRKASEPVNWRGNSETSRMPPMSPG